jgi:hypothetical protein
MNFEKLDQIVIEFIENLHCAEKNFKNNLTAYIKILQENQQLIFIDIRQWKHFFLSLYTRLMNGNKTTENCTKEQIKYKTQNYKRKTIKALRDVEEYMQDIFCDIAFNDKYKITYETLTEYLQDYDNFKNNRVFNPQPENANKYKVEMNMTEFPVRYTDQFQQIVHYKCKNKNNNIKLQIQENINNAKKRKLKICLEGNEENFSNKNIRKLMFNKDICAELCNAIKADYSRNVIDSNVPPKTSYMVHTVTQSVVNDDKNKQATGNSKNKNKKIMDNKVTQSDSEEEVSLDNTNHRTNEAGESDKSTQYESESSNAEKIVKKKNMTINIVKTKRKKTTKNTLVKDIEPDKSIKIVKYKKRKKAAKNTLAEDIEPDKSIKIVKYTKRKKAAKNILAKDIEPDKSIKIVKYKNKIQHKKKNLKSNVSLINKVKRKKSLPIKKLKSKKSIKKVANQKWGRKKLAVKNPLSVDKIIIYTAYLQEIKKNMNLYIEIFSDRIIDYNYCECFIHSVEGFNYFNKIFADFMENNIIVNNNNNFEPTFDFGTSLGGENDLLRKSFSYSFDKLLYENATIDNLSKIETQSFPDYFVILIIKFIVGALKNADLIPESAFACNTDGNLGIDVLLTSPGAKRELPHYDLPEEEGGVSVIINQTMLELSTIYIYDIHNFPTSVCIPPCGFVYFKGNVLHYGSENNTNEDIYEIYFRIDPNYIHQANEVNAAKFMDAGIMKNDDAEDNENFIKSFCDKNFNFQPRYIIQTMVNAAYNKENVYDSFREMLNKEGCFILNFPVHINNEHCEKYNYIMKNILQAESQKLSEKFAGIFLTEHEEYTHKSLYDYNKELTVNFLAVLNDLVLTLKHDIKTFLFVPALFLKEKFELKVVEELNKIATPRNEDKNSGCSGNLIYINMSKDTMHVKFRLKTFKLEPMGFFIVEILSKCSTLEFFGEKKNQLLLTLRLNTTGDFAYSQELTEIIRDLKNDLSIKTIEYYEEIFKAKFENSKENFLKYTERNNKHVDTLKYKISGDELELDSKTKIIELQNDLNNFKQLYDSQNKSFDFFLRNSQESVCNLLEKLKAEKIDLSKHNGYDAEENEIFDGNMEEDILIKSFSLNNFYK